MIVFSGYSFFPFFVRAFRMRLLYSIHDEIGNRSFACWFCLDFSLEIAVPTNRSKGTYKGNRRKEVYRLFGRQKHMHTASEAPQLRPSFEFTFTLPPKNEKPLSAKTTTAVLHYHRKNAAIFWFYRFRQSRYRRKMKNRLPPKNYRRIALPPKKYRHILVLTLPPKSLPPETRKPPTA